MTKGRIPYGIRFFPIPPLQPAARQTGKAQRHKKPQNQENVVINDIIFPCYLF